MRPTRRTWLPALVASAALAITPVALGTPALAAPTTTAATSTTASSVAPLDIPQQLWDRLSDSDRARFASLAAHLPNSTRERAAAYSSPVHDALLRAIDRQIDPGDYECGPTALDAFVDQLIGELEVNDIIVVAYLFPYALDYPTYDALLFGTAGDPDYALEKGYRNELGNAFKKAQRFWGSDTVRTDDIQLLAMHGDMLADVEKVERMMLFFGDSTPETVEADARFLSTYVATEFPRGYDNPLWTLNAYAFHEIGQPVGGSPEGTRRSELEADYMSAYFLTHKRGMARNEARVIEAIESFYVVGDCGFDSDGHHGTPNQRRRAAELGAALAREGQKKGQILPAETVVQRFAAVLPVILAPDA